MDFIYVSIFVAGIWFLIKGADIIINHATKVAHEMGISRFMIGLTLVAFSTTLPELSVSVISAFSGVATIATGTIIGSIIVNIGLILGLAAIIRPLTTDEETLKLSYFMTFFILMLALVLFDGIVWYEGLILMMAFCMYIYSEFIEVRRQRELQALVGPKKKLIPKDTEKHDKLKHVLMCLLGGVIVVMGAEMLISSTINLARWLNISELLISLLVISVGTSLPELAVVLTGAIKRMRGISIGDIIGANIFNVFVLGFTSMVTTVPVTMNVMMFNIPLMIMLSFLLIFSIKSGWKITKNQGFILLLLYAVFVVLQFV